MPQTDLYQTVTDQIVVALKSGTAPWVRPWKASRGQPHNGATGYVYRGINLLLCWSSGYSDQRWYTFNQVRGLGRSHVRKGERGMPIIFWTFIDRTGENGETEHIPLLRSYTVFNHSQVEWEPGKEPQSDTKNFDPSVGFDKAAALVMKSSAEVWHGSDVPNYRPSTDRIGMPDAAAFRTPADYWATMLHELTHWTGHTARCNRSLVNRFGSEAYAAEELVAELGSAFLCAELDVQGHLQHPEYIGNWIRVLGDDSRAIFTAARLAREAVALVTMERSEHKTESVASTSLAA